jgi:hypothetical protein
MRKAYACPMWARKQSNEKDENMKHTATKTTPRSAASYVDSDQCSTVMIVPSQSVIKHHRRGDKSDHVELSRSLWARTIDVMTQAATRATLQVRPNKANTRTIIDLAFDAKVSIVGDEPEKNQPCKFVVSISSPGEKKPLSKFTVSFDIDDPSDPKGYSISIAASPTQLLTGRAALPAEGWFGIGYFDGLFLATVPWRMLLAVCRKADPKFRPSSSMLYSTLGLAAVDRCTQRIRLAMPLVHAGLAMELMHSAYQPRRLMSDGKNLASFDIGDVLGVRSKLTGGLSRGGGSRAAMILDAKSGTHPIATARFNARPASKSKPGASKVEQPKSTEFVGVEITLAERGIKRLVAEARRLAKQHGTYDSASGMPNNALPAYVVEWAKALVEQHYVERRGGTSFRGYRGWLVCHVLQDAMHLHELFVRDDVQLRKVEEWLSKWSKNDERYERAFGKWQSQTSTKKSLRQLIEAEGVKSETASKRIRELNELGVSGRIPPNYWLGRELVTLGAGATNDEASRFLQHAHSGKAVKHSLRRWRKRVEPGQLAVRTMLTEVDQHSMLPTAPHVLRATREEGDSSAEAKRRPSNSKRSGDEGAAAVAKKHIKGTLRLRKPITTRVPTKAGSMERGRTGDKKGWPSNVIPFRPKPKDLTTPPL